jgi:hypothetical protein
LDAAGLLTRVYIVRAAGGRVATTARFSVVG